MDQKTSEKNNMFKITIRQISKNVFDKMGFKSKYPKDGLASLYYLITMANGKSFVIEWKGVSIYWPSPAFEMARQDAILDGFKMSRAQFGIKEVDVKRMIKNDLSYLASS